MDPRDRVNILAQEALEEGDPIGWFDRLYTEATAGEAIVPWDRGEPHPLLVTWAQATKPASAGKSALVVGCGLGNDAEFVSALGFATTAFDVSQTAIESARERYPESTVDYRVADLLHPPADWHHAFDLVVEIFTVQALPRELRPALTASVSQFVAAGGGRLVVIAGRQDEGESLEEGPPWRMTHADIEAFAANGLDTVSITPVERRPEVIDWVAEFIRR